MRILLLLSLLANIPSAAAHVKADSSARVSLKIYTANDFDRDLFYFYLLKDGKYLDYSSLENLNVERSWPLVKKSDGTIGRNMESYKYNSCQYLYEDLAEGLYTVDIHYVYGKSWQISLWVRQDTSIVLKAPVQIKRIPSLSLSQLSKADTVYMHMISRGCFHHNQESMLFFRANHPDSAGVKFSYYEWVYKGNSAHKEFRVKYFQVPLSVFSDLLALQHGCRELEKKADLSFSTSSKNLAIIAGSRLFYFSDQGVLNWNLYSEFRKKYTGM